MPNERWYWPHTHSHTPTQTNAHTFCTTSKDFRHFSLTCCKFQPIQTKPVFKEDSFNHFRFFIYICQSWLSESNALSSIFDTWQPLDDVIFWDDLWIMAISAQIKAIIIVHLPFTHDCVHCNICSMGICSGPEWRNHLSFASIGITVFNTERII